MPYKIFKKMKWQWIPVLTHCKPKIHDLEKLCILTGNIQSAFLVAFAENSLFERTCLKLLCQAYAESRYNPDDHITTEQLIWLAEHIGHLKVLAEKYCRGKIDRFG
ncbi:hypothetical protein [Gynuella sunshinyii]|uniref:HEPN domain-containing protein n=1 Tax=Gynuella sunshinyii YC6258 TaxID=1445510 RepID=A0A0C5VSM3_9GAMM|nr:hypothetical protein [Gynuella sunshinyii]AJQ93269.1 hypothetical Protein YC6258_01221 [Gynuella sunshinyii YC6258]